MLSLTLHYDTKTVQSYILTIALLHYFVYNLYKIHYDYGTLHNKSNFLSYFFQYHPLLPKYLNNYFTYFLPSLFGHFF